MRRLQGPSEKIGVLVLLFVLLLRGSSETQAAGGPPAPPEHTGQIRALVILKEQADVKPAVAHLLGQGRQKAARAAAVSQALKAVADRTQGPLRGLLTAAEKRGEASRVRPLWIHNAIAVSATPQLLWQISERPEVLAVIPDHPITLAAPPLSVSTTAEILKDTDPLRPLAVSGPATQYSKRVSIGNTNFRRQTCSTLDQSPYDSLPACW